MRESGGHPLKPPAEGDSPPLRYPLLRHMVQSIGSPDTGISVIKSGQLNVARIDVEFGIDVSEKDTQLAHNTGNLG